MYRYIFTNKWFLGGIGFLIIFAVACVLWYQHDIADERKAAAEAEEMLRQSEAVKENAVSDSEVEQTVNVDPLENSMQNAEKPITDPLQTTEKSITDPLQVEKETPAQIVATTDVPVSPNGFGPYPDIPAEMGIPKHGVKYYWEKLSKNPKQELLAHVRIKLYQQGIQATGATYKQNGLIYPIIKGVRYVEWDTLEYPDGSVERYVTRSTGHPDDNFMREAEGRVLEADIPGHLKIYTYPDGGIDPYDFLDLSKE